VRAPGWRVGSLLGENWYGSLGYGNTIAIGDDEAPGSVGPVDLGPGAVATAISAGGREVSVTAPGGQHTCAVLDNGGVRCWGAAVDGRLGHGNTATIGDDATPGSAAPGRPHRHRKDIRQARSGSASTERGSAVRSPSTSKVARN
jgi:hypothetical protein